MTETQAIIGKIEELIADNVENQHDYTVQRGDTVNGKPAFIISPFDLDALKEEDLKNVRTLALKAFTGRCESVAVELVSEIVTITLVGPIGSDEEVITAGRVIAASAEWGVTLNATRTMPCAVFRDGEPEGVTEEFTVEIYSGGIVGASSIAWLPKEAHEIFRHQLRAFPFDPSWMDLKAEEERKANQ